MVCINGQDDCGENAGRYDNVRTLSQYWVKAGSTCMISGNIYSG